MNKIFRSPVVAVILLTTLFAAARETEDTRTRIFDERFTTLKVQVQDDFYAPPIIMLGSNRHILVSFDEPGDERSYLRYSLTHCDENWQPDGLLESEYLDGFNEADVNDYAFSQATFRHYINYRILIPSEDMNPLVSGNYLLKVYPEDDSDKTLLQARFSISEERVRLEGDVTTQTDLGSNTDRQQLNMHVITGDYPVRDPYQDIIVTVEQNGVEQSAAAGVKPLRMEPGRLIYEHIPGLIFPAGNEYRRFETVRTDFAGMNIESNAYENDGYTATLKTDKERANRPYIFDRTQHGRYKIDDYNSTDPDLGADYVLTRFSLDFPRVMNGDVYVDGEFTHHLADDSCKMTYNEQTGLYELEMMLKQGSYNYQYVARNTEGLLTPALIEGNHYETSNEYTVKIFQKVPGQRYTRLIGTATFLSNQ